MASFEKVNGWINSNIKTLNADGEISQSAIQELIALADAEDEELKNAQNTFLQLHANNDLIRAIGGLKKREHDPEEFLNRTKNGFGIVTKHRYHVEGEGLIVLSLIVPGYYCLMVTVRADKDLNFISSRVKFYNFYCSYEQREFSIVASVAGSTLDRIFEYKDKVDSNSRIEAKLNKPTEEELNFKLIDVNGKEVITP